MKPDNTLNRNAKKQALFGSFLTTMRIFMDYSTEHVRLTFSSCGRAVSAVPMFADMRARRTTRR